MQHGSDPIDDELAYDFRRCVHSIRVPEPLAFERAALAPALHEHALMLQRRCESFRLLIGNMWPRDVPFKDIDLFTGLLAVRSSGEEEAYVVHRAEAARRVQRYRALQRELLVAHQDGSCFRVVVATADALSLHTLRVTRAERAELPSVAVVDSDVLVEPIRQWHHARGEHTVTRWRLAADTEPRYAWVRTPRAPASDDEEVDRVLSLYEARIRGRIWEYLKDGRRVHEVLVAVRSQPALADRLGFYWRDSHSAFTSEHPWIRRAIDTCVHTGRVPVFFEMGSYVALRWIDVRTETGDAPNESPRGLIERPLHIVDPDATIPPDPCDPKPWVPRVVRSPGPITQTDIDCEIGRLATLSDAALNREIAAAGFDPMAERAQLGLREGVVLAITQANLPPDAPPWKPRDVAVF